MNHYFVCINFSKIITTYKAANIGALCYLVSSPAWVEVTILVFVTPNLHLSQAANLEFSNLRQKQDRQLSKVWLDLKATICETLNEEDIWELQ